MAVEFAQNGVDMNKQQVKGAATEAVGKVQKNVGRATRNGTQEAKGAAREMVGKAQKAYGNAKESVKRTAKSAKSDVRSSRDARTTRDRDIDRHAR